MKRTRYCGEVKIELEYLGLCKNRDRFFCRVTAAGHVWQCDEVFVDPMPTATLDDVFDVAARGAVHHGSKYNLDYLGYDSDIPDSAPPRDIAQAINDAASVDDKGYVISREEPTVTNCG